MKRRKIAGLNLWTVEVSNSYESFWVTTGTNSLSVATRKAQRFVDRYFGKRVKLSLVKHRGTLDA